MKSFSSSSLIVLIAVAVLPWVQFNKAHHNDGIDLSKIQIVLSDMFGNMPFKIVNNSPTMKIKCIYCNSLNHACKKDSSVVFDLDIKYGLYSVDLKYDFICSTREKSTIENIQFRTGIYDVLLNWNSSIKYDKYILTIFPKTVKAKSRRLEFASQNNSIYVNGLKNNARYIVCLRGYNARIISRYKCSSFVTDLSFLEFQEKLRIVPTSYSIEIFSEEVLKLNFDLYFIQFREASKAQCKSIIIIHKKTGFNRSIGFPSCPTMSFDESNTFPNKTLRSLLPYTKYNITIGVFKASKIEHSFSKIILTNEGKSEAVRNLRVTMNLSKLAVAFDPPTKINGNIKYFRLMLYATLECSSLEKSKVKEVYEFNKTYIELNHDCKGTYVVKVIPVNNWKEQNGYGDEAVKVYSYNGLLNRLLLLINLVPIAVCFILIICMICCCCFVDNNQQDRRSIISRIQSNFYSGIYETIDI